MTINLNLHNIAYKNALGNAIQIVIIFWGLLIKNYLLAVEFQHFCPKTVSGFMSAFTNHLNGDYIGESRYGNKNQGNDNL